MGGEKAPWSKRSLHRKFSMESLLFLIKNLLGVVSNGSASKRHIPVCVK